MKMYFAVFVVVSACAVVAVAEGLSSGLQVGERTPVFLVFDITGPNKGKALCYICGYGGAPMVIAFVKDTGGDATRLVVKIQKLVTGHEADGLKAFVVYEAGSEKKDDLERIAADHHITIPLVLPRDLDQALKLYKVNPEAKNTIWVAKSNTILFTAANVTDETFSNVIGAVTKMLGK
ncbi:MAG: hypothetical protein GXP25_11375 [Planctomycetes bacterium]|nr:hypothetical protein [Planctomycetota bacterium]